MTLAETLIHAVQSGDTEELQRAINTVTERVENRGFHAALVNQGLSGSDLTALHVACKAYSHYARDPDLARTFDQMVQLLLDAGAVPGKEARIGRERITSVMACEGRIPPSLQNYLSHRAENSWDRNVKSTSNKDRAAKLRVGHQQYQDLLGGYFVKGLALLH